MARVAADEAAAAASARNDAPARVRDAEKQAENVERLAQEAADKAARAEREAERLALEARGAVEASNDETIVRQPLVQFAPPVRGSVDADGTEVVVESVDGGVQLSVGKTSVVLDAKQSAVIRRKLDQAAALL